MRRIVDEYSNRADNTAEVLAALKSQLDAGNEQHAKEERGWELEVEALRERAHAAKEARSREAADAAGAHARQVETANAAHVQALDKLRADFTAAAAEEGRKIRVEHAQQVEELEAAQAVLAERQTLVQRRAKEDAGLLAATHAADVKSVCEQYETTLSGLRREVATAKVEIADLERQIGDNDDITASERASTELTHAEDILALERRCDERVLRAGERTDAKNAELAGATSRHGDEMAAALERMDTRVEEAEAQFQDNLALAQHDANIAQERAARAEAAAAQQATQHAARTADAAGDAAAALRDLERRLRVECDALVAGARKEADAAAASLAEFQSAATHEANQMALEFETRMSGMLPEKARAMLESTIASLQEQNRALQMRSAMAGPR